MLAFSNAKINLGLNILNKRADGYHNIESIFIPVNLYDVVEIIQSKKTTVTNYGKKINGPCEENLCYKAWELMHEKYDVKPINIHILKRIPMGAGLGGGSSNAAFTIMLINDLFNLNLSIDTLKSLSHKIGSDCSFFIENKPKLVKETGNILEDINLELAAYKIAIVNPKIHISTIEAYKNCIPKLSSNNLKEVIKLPVEDWEGKINNDFENWAFETYPSIKETKEKLYSLGAVFASMTGSGSTVIGLFKKNQSIDLQKTFLNYETFLV